MAPCSICYLIVMLFYFEKKWLLIRNLAAILPLKSKLSGKFQRFNAKDGRSKWWKVVEFQKVSIKTKNCKTFYEAQAVSQPPSGNYSGSPHPTPHQIKPYYVLRRYMEIHRHFLSKCFKNAVLGRPEMVQYKCFFWHQTETYLLEKRLSSRKSEN